VIPGKRLSNRGIIGLGIGLCIVLALFLAWWLGLLSEIA
jgi:hypothetical protein